MQLVKFKVFQKNSALSSMKSNASCSQGWLRLVVQTIFFMITVTSFTLILIISLKPSGNTSPHCDVIYCQVECLEIPFYDDRLQSIYNALQETQRRDCHFIALFLKEPYFINGILPSKWMGDINMNISRLHIKGGNLNYITPGAFHTSIGRTIQQLQFTNLTFSSLENRAFSGLDNVIQLYFEDCKMGDIQPGLLRPVSDSLQFLFIFDSSLFTPIDFTGSVDLPVFKAVFYVRNNLSDVIIRQNTFSRIQTCEYLFLHWCKIEAIELGAFDRFDNIKTLDLSNNLLVTVPIGLFDNIISKASIETQVFIAHNLWRCDCDTQDFQLLASKGLLGDEPVCDKPQIVQNMTFSDFDKQICKHCSGIETEELDNDMAIVNFNHSIKLNNISDIIRKNTFNLSRMAHQSYICKFKNVISAGKVNDIKTQYKNNWIYPRFRIDTLDMSIVQMDIAVSDHKGILWFEDVCPQNIYCIDITTNNIRLFNVHSKTRYVFCQWSLKTGNIDYDDCIALNLTDTKDSYHIPSRIYKYIVFYFLMATSGLLLGGCFVYIALWWKPTLLKGSKRLLFVKHKEVDALVLPPKVPLRATKSNIPFSGNVRNIFVVPSDMDQMHRSRSVRSNSSSNSSAPSYISALQPTDDQLEQWRTQQQDEDESIYASIRSEFSDLSKIFRRDSVSYIKLDEDITYSKS